MYFKPLFFTDDDSDTDEPPPTCDNIHSTEPFANRKFKVPSSFNPPGAQALEAMVLANEHGLNQRPSFKRAPRENISLEEKLAITSLKNNSEIVIKPADKGSAVVVMNRCDYLAEGYRQLSDRKFYQQLESNPTDDYRKEINSVIDSMYARGEIDTSVHNYLYSHECRTSVFYLLPKIHKGVTPPPGRPILSANGCPTEKISQFVDHFLSKTASAHASYVKDTTHFLQIIRNIDRLPPGSLLASFDVQSLYTNIPNDLGLAAAKKALQKLRPQPGLKPSNDSLVKLMELVLTRNNFQFNGENFIQTGGVSMGTRMAPNFSDDFLADFEELYVYTYNDQPHTWVRFLDDIFCIWEHGIDKLNEFCNYLNSCTTAMKFTMEWSDKTVTFLDTRIIQTSTGLTTDLYTKPTDAHNYLMYSSAHPRSCKASIPYSQFLRIRRICSSIEDFDKNALSMAKDFLKRGYPTHIIEESIIKVRRSNRDELLAPKLVKTTASDTIDPTQEILVTTYNPNDNTLLHLAKKNWGILGKCTNTRFIHDHRLLTAYRRPKNLRDMLVRADCQVKTKTKSPTSEQSEATKAFMRGPNTNPLRTNTIQTSITQYLRLGNPIQREITSSSSTSDLNCTQQLPVRRNSLQNLVAKPKPNTCTNKKCRYCPKLNKTGTIKCTITGTEYTCKKNISCKSSNLIYAITCNCCSQQYVGQTKRTLANRFQGHFYNTTSAVEYQRTVNQDLLTTGTEPRDGVSAHFSKTDHRGTQDMSIHVLEFIRLPPNSGKALTLRLKIEKAWIHRLRCVAPTGLNIFD